MNRITRIAMHEMPHLDEVAATEILKRWGEKTYPGIGSAAFDFWSYGGATPDGRSAKDWLNDGVICLGQGFGSFDEHPDPVRGIPRKTGECTTSLVAKALGFNGNCRTPVGRAISYLVKLVTDLDLNGNSPLSGLEHALSAMSRTGISSIEILDWGTKAVAAMLDDQIEFQKEFGRASPGDYCYLQVGLIVLAIVHSASEHACKVARVHGPADVVIRREPATGHVTIMRNAKRSIPMDVIVAKLRELESQHLGEPMPAVEIIAVEGRLGGWYYHPRLELATTGGNRTARSTAPPKTPFDEIVAAVISVLESHLSPSTHSSVVSV